MLRRTRRCGCAPYLCLCPAICNNLALNAPLCSLLPSSFPPLPHQAPRRRPARPPRARRPPPAPASTTGFRPSRACATWRATRPRWTIRCAVSAPRSSGKRRARGCPRSTPCHHAGSARALCVCRWPRATRFFMMLTCLSAQHHTLLGTCRSQLCCGDLRLMIRCRCDDSGSYRPSDQIEGQIAEAEAECAAYEVCICDLCRPLPHPRMNSHLVGVAAHFRSNSVPTSTSDPASRSPIRRLSSASPRRRPTAPPTAPPKRRSQPRWPRCSPQRPQSSPRRMRRRRCSGRVRKAPLARLLAGCPGHRLCYYPARKQ